MHTSLDDLLTLIEGASSPAEVFGPLAGDQGAALRRRYRELAAAAHPDRHPDRTAAAQRVFTALGSWYELGRRLVAQGAYGRTALLDLSVGGRRYVGFAAPLAGDLCDLYPVESDAGPALLKIARRPGSADLMAAEAHALALLARELAGDRMRAHFPTLHEAFSTADGAGVRRRAHALGLEGGTLSLAAVLRALPGGLAPADAAWIFNRILAALAVTHGLGLVHGAVLPEHVLIRPADHNGLLIDWCYSVPAGEPLRAISRPRAADYPPEVGLRRPATAATDLYMAARLMSRLLGGDGDAESIPARAPAALRALLAACLLAAPHRRPTDAWQLYDDFRAVLRDHYGPPVFRPFPLTA